MKQELQLQNLTLRKEQMEQAREQEAYQSHRSRAMESRDRVYDRYPALADKQSVYRKQFDDYVANAQSDPTTQQFSIRQNGLNYCHRICIRKPSARGSTSRSSTAASRCSSASGSTDGTQAKVLTTGTAAQPVNTPVTREGLLQQLPQMSNDDIYKMLGAPGGAQPLR